MKVGSSHVSPRVSRNPDTIKSLNYMAWGYIDSGLLTPGNNLAENAIWSFAVLRKNWLFSGNPERTKASAVLYSLIETAKANGLEPYRYLNLFEHLVKSALTLFLLLRMWGTFSSHSRQSN